MELAHKQRLILYFTTVGFITILSGVAGTQAPVELPNEAPVVEERLIEEVKQDPEDFIDTESYVRHYFSDLPVMVDVAFCESTFRQYGEDGNVILGKVNKNDVGVMQINTGYHLEDAEDLGYDIYTLDGNLDYARALYEKQGTSPWVHSEKCWSKSPISSTLAVK